MNRRDWQEDYIDPAKLDADPIAEFGKWFEHAEASSDELPNAMSLATVSADGRPTARLVLLKGFDAEGFEFYTNYDSPKCADIAANANVAMVFHWKPLFRQVRIEGAAEKVSVEESEAYWATRPRGSRIAGWASNQSAAVEAYSELEDRVEALEKEHPGEDVPLPPNWGGYRVKPVRFEFWLARPSRLHDRFEYRLKDGGTWAISRLQP